MIRPRRACKMPRRNEAQHSNNEAATTRGGQRMPMNKKGVKIRRNRGAKRRGPHASAATESQIADRRGRATMEPASATIAARHTPDRDQTKRSRPIATGEQAPQPRRASRHPRNQPGPIMAATSATKRPQPGQTKRGMASKHPSERSKRRSKATSAQQDTGETNRAARTEKRQRAAEDGRDTPQRASRAARSPHRNPQRAGGRAREAPAAATAGSPARCPVPLITEGCP